MMEKPKVGQTLYSLNVGNAARHTEKKLTPVIVTKVGRKYFTCKENEDSYWETQYHIEDWKEKSDFSATSCLYPSPLAWENEKEAFAICQLIWESFTYGQNKRHVSLVDLRTIKRILEGK